MRSFSVAAACNFSCYSHLHWFFCIRNVILIILFIHPIVACLLEADTEIVVFKLVNLNFNTFCTRFGFAEVWPCSVAVIGLYPCSDKVFFFHIFILVNKFSHVINTLKMYVYWKVLQPTLYWWFLVHVTSLKTTPEWSCSFSSQVFISFNLESRICCPTFDDLI
jgi:hypothetical protein